jgi:hypothetical protein
MTRMSRLIWEPKSEKPAVTPTVHATTREENCGRCGKARLACNLRHDRDETGARIKVCPGCKQS